MDILRTTKCPRCGRAIAFFNVPWTRHIPDEKLCTECVIKTSQEFIQNHYTQLANENRALKKRVKVLEDGIVAAIGFVDGILGGPMSVSYDDWTKIRAKWRALKDNEPSEGR